MAEVPGEVVFFTAETMEEVVTIDEVHGGALLHEDVESDMGKRSMGDGQFVRNLALPD
jgi:hypothetical protein